jgi:hypothetical protein
MYEHLMYAVWARDTVGGRGRVAVEVAGSDQCCTVCTGTRKGEGYTYSGDEGLL